MTLSGRHSFHTPDASSDMSGFFVYRGMTDSLEMEVLYLA